MRSTCLFRLFLLPTFLIPRVLSFLSWAFSSFTSLFFSFFLYLLYSFLSSLPSSAAFFLQTPNQVSFWYSAAPSQQLHYSVSAWFNVYPPKPKLVWVLFILSEPRTKFVWNLGDHAEMVPGKNSTVAPFLKIQLCQENCLDDVVFFLGKGMVPFENCGVLSKWC